MNSKLETHQQLVKVIEDEATIVFSATGARKEHHKQVLRFLIQLQIISAKDL